jgi:hypothetical protein
MHGCPPPAWSELLCPGDQPAGPGEYAAGAWLAWPVQSPVLPGHGLHLLPGSRRNPGTVKRNTCVIGLSRSGGGGSELRSALRTDPRSAPRFGGQPFHHPICSSARTSQAPTPRARGFASRRHTRKTRGSKGAPGHEWRRTQRISTAGALPFEVVLVDTEEEPPRGGIRSARARVRGASSRGRCRLTQPIPRARPRSGLAREDPLGRPARSHLRRAAAALSRLWR